MIRLIALDFDFTLIDYLPGVKPRIEPPALEYLTELARSGVKVGIVTGRIFPGFEETFRGVGGKWGSPFPNYMICADSYLYEADEAGVFSEDERENQNVRDEISDKVTKMLPYVQDCLERLKTGGVGIRTWSVSGEHGITVDTVSHEAAQRCIELMDGRIPDAHMARNCHLFHVTPVGSGKGASVLRYAKKLGINPDEVMAVGDSLNDLTMLDGKLGFRSGTVGNADERVKQAVRMNGGFVSDKRASLGTLECIQYIMKEG